MAQYGLTPDALAFLGGAVPRQSYAVRRDESGRSLDRTALANLGGDDVVDPTDPAEDVAYRNSLLGAPAYVDRLIGTREKERIITGRETPVDFGPEIRAEVCELAEVLVRDDAGRPKVDRHGVPFTHQILTNREVFSGRLSTFLRAFPDGEDRARRRRTGVYGGQERKIFLLGPS